jgi:hypothetical protein
MPIFHVSSFIEIKFAHNWKLVTQICSSSTIYLQRDSQTRRNFPTKRSNSPTKMTRATPVKMLMEQDMWKERRPDEEPQNVVARLMGLHEPPSQQPNFPLGRQLDKKYQCGGFEENYWNLKSKKESKCHQN